MRQHGIFKGDLLRIKKRIIAEMKNKKTETWNSLDSLLTDLVAV
jgi:hypothetical protein